MRLVFAGTPAFAATALEALIAARHEIVLVLTQPDRPAGRGMQLQPSAVKTVALANGLALAQPQTLKDPAVQAQLSATTMDAMVVAAYGLILPPAVLAMPPGGCLNIHASLLPRWRGAAPIQRALLAGDGETGITIMQMDAGLDTGAMLLKKALPIAANDTTQTLHDKLAPLGAETIVLALDLLGRDGLAAEAQDDALATYAAKITKEEARVDWHLPAPEIARRVRAYNPYPAAFSLLRGEPLKLWLANSIAGAGTPGTPGTVLAADKSGVVVACGSGALQITELQRAGGKRLDAAQFLAGMKISCGECLA